MNILRDHEIEYHFERRKYGTGASTKFFTWLLWRVAGQKEWKSYGDPWPHVRVSKVDIAAALGRIRFDFLILPGSRTDEPGFHGSLLQLHTGRTVRVVDKDEKTITVVSLDDEHGQEFIINLLEYPTAVVEVL